MTDEELTKEYIRNHVHYEVATKANGTEYAKEVSNVTIGQAYSDGLKAGKDMNVSIKWHKVADGDLPKENINILLYYREHFCTNTYFTVGYYKNECFYNDCEMEENAIAWCEIPKYTEE